MKPLFWLIIVCLVFVPIVKAEVYLNEISAAGTPEYVELYNNSPDSIKLENWYIDDIPDKGSAPKPFSLTLDGLGFGIIELNAIFNNSGGDSVRLLDTKQNEVDRYDYTVNLSLNDIFLRCPDGGDTWTLTQTGSKGLSNQPGCLALTPTLPTEPFFFPTPMALLSVTLLPTLTLTPTPSPNPPPQPEVFLSEVMVYPDKDSEWVELYNPNPKTITLTDWFLDDQENGGSAPKPFSITIQSQNYSLIQLNNQIFNNDGDQVRLLSPEQKEIDRFEYEKANKGRTFSRSSLNRTAPWCETTPTLNQPNTQCLTLPIPTLNLIATQNLLTTITKSNTDNTLKPKTNLPTPAFLQFGVNFYRQPEPKVLGVKIQKIKVNTDKLVFWWQFTKISLWLNLLIGSGALVYLSLSLLPLSRLWPG